jgi:hypothetical protein
MIDRNAGGCLKGIGGKNASNPLLLPLQVILKAVKI